MIKNKKRLEIHISSLSIDELRRLTMDKFLVRQNIQLSRIFSIQDPNIDILYISAFEMTPEVIGYYTKILELGNIQDVNSRLTFLSPDTSIHIPTHVSTTKALLYSPSVIKTIKNMVKQNPNLYYQTYELNDCLYLNYKGFTYLKNMHLF